tara:strand:+ start:169 stop:816 length:648 start_codon:yes stop_codon:yes gene_type:complete
MYRKNINYVNKIYAIVLARKNSKRIKDKNIRLFKSKPLIQWSFDEAIKSKGINKILCSTDDKRIINKYKNYSRKLEFPYLRPSHFAKSSTTSESTILHLLNYYQKKNNYLPKSFILIQPTSPLRKKKHIDNAILKFNENCPVSLISVVKINNVYVKDKNFLSRSKNTFKFNGAIYITDTRAFMSSQKIYHDKKTIFMEMDEKSSLDIDYEYQLVT